jgi:hypothetical protein
MKRLLALACLLTTCLAAGAARAETAASDPKAVALADRVMESLGGKSHWDQLRGLEWSFGAEVNDTVRTVRRHAWDKYTGWHRVEGTTRTGTKFVLIDNLNTGEGKAWMNGQPIEGDSLKKLMGMAKSMWINDTYWMLMPYKLRDPGVTIKDAGTTTEGGVTWDALALSFENVGQTPGDRYWVYVDHATGRVGKWEMILQSDPPAGPRTGYTWEGWQQHDGLWFPTAHRAENRNVFTRDIQTVSEFPAGTFEKP